MIGTGSPRGIVLLRACLPVLLLALCSMARAVPAEEAERDIAFEPHLGRQLVTTVTLRDSGGHKVALAQFLGRAPLVLVLGSLSCGEPCLRVMRNATDALGRAGLKADADYVPLFVSIDPRDEPAAGGIDGWHVLVGARGASEIARAVGFRFYQDPQSGGFAHPNGFVLLTREGRVSHYFVGADFASEEVGAAARAAAQGQTPGLIERVMLTVFHEPLAARYSGAILWLLQVALALFAGYLLFAVWGEH